MVKKRYKARQAISDQKAQVYGERISSLHSAHGHITPYLIVADAIDEGSPLHDYFEWDDDKASGLWRLHQARMLLCAIAVEVHPNKGEKRTIVVREFHNVTTEENDRMYVNNATIRKHDYLREQVVQTALDEAQAWVSRYEDLKELFHIVDAIQITIKKLKATA